MPGKPRIQVNHSFLLCGRRLTRGWVRRWIVGGEITREFQGWIL